MCRIPRLARGIRKARSCGSASQAVFGCSLVDLSKCADSTISVETSDYGGTSVADSYTALLDTLRNPAPSICLRVLLWLVKKDSPVASELLDICGMDLKIDPQFFRTLINVVDPLQPSRAQQHTAIGSQAETPPLLIVVGWDDENCDNSDINLDRSDWWLDETPPSNPLQAHLLYKIRCNARKEKFMQ